MDPLLDPEHRDLEDGLLRAGRDVHMSPATRDKTLAALGLGVAGVATTTAAKASTSSWLLSKTGLLSVGALGAATVAGAVALSSGEPSEDGPAAVETRSEVSAPAASTPSGPAAEEVGASAQQEEATADEELREAAGEGTEGATPRAPTNADAIPSDSSDARKSKSTSHQKGTDSGSTTSSLREELSHIGRVEGALRSGDPAKALALLDDYRTRFDRRKLGLEAEVLTIVALHDSGSVSAARARARAFLERHPNSPLGARVKKYAGE